MKTSEYEATDKLFSSYVVTSDSLTTKFYLNTEDCGTDMLSRAHVYRWPDDAQRAADSANATPAWFNFGFTWAVESYAAASLTPTT